jgi:hypothetical protein
MTSINAKDKVEVQFGTLPIGCTFWYAGSHSKYIKMELISKTRLNGHRSDYNAVEISGKYAGCVSCFLSENFVYINKKSK